MRRPLRRGVRVSFIAVVVLTAAACADVLGLEPLVETAIPDAAPEAAPPAPVEAGPDPDSATDASPD